MSLGKLLASGRSLAGGPSVARYNVSERNRLPKFGPARNPFASPTAKSAAETVAVSAPVETPAPEAAARPASSPFAVAELKKTQRIPGLAALERSAQVKRGLQNLVQSGRALGMAGLAKAMALATALFSRMKRVRRKEPQSVIPRFGKPAVQGELSLDNVRVVRNDLEESDLEIVTVQTDTSTQVAPSVAPATPNRGPVPPALKKLTNRMLGVKLS